MYAHTVELALPIDQAIDKLKSVLAEVKMGIVSDVDVQATLKVKLDHEIPPYRLLGICSPDVARRVLEADRDAGALLPCGCCAYEIAPGMTRIALQDPGVVAASAGHPDISTAMAEVQSHFMEVLAKLRA